ncbi:MAG: PilZ domain-containing protein [Candidatus Methylomirabilales bacterium]
MRRVKKERRCHPRWVVGGRFAARMARVHEANLINISTAGALVEHVHPVRPGTTLFLSLSLSEQEVGLMCRVVRSRAHRCETGSSGERDLIYRTGLEFLGTLEPVPRQGDAARSA